MNTLAFDRNLQSQDKRIRIQATEAAEHREQIAKRLIEEVRAIKDQSTGTTSHVRTEDRLSISHEEERPAF